MLRASLPEVGAFRQTAAAVVVVLDQEGGQGSSAVGPPCQRWEPSDRQLRLLLLLLLLLTQREAGAAVLQGLPARGGSLQTGSGVFCSPQASVDQEGGQDGRALAIQVSQAGCTDVPMHCCVMLGQVLAAVSGICPLPGQEHVGAVHEDVLQHASHVWAPACRSATGVCSSAGQTLSPVHSTTVQENGPLCRVGFPRYPPLVQHPSACFRQHSTP